MNKQEIIVHILGCWAGFQKAGDACSGVLVQAGGKNFLFDIGSGVFSKLLEKIDLEDLEAVFISHLHYDHMGDLEAIQSKAKYLRRTKQMNRKIDVFAPSEPLESYQRIDFSDIKLQSVGEAFCYQIGEVKITAVPVSHTVSCYAYCIKAYGKKIVYYTDTVLREQDIDFIKDADLFICEATKTEGSRHTIGLGHMSDYEAGRLATLANAKSLCLYHLPGDVDVQQIYDNARTQFNKELNLAVNKRIYIL